MKVKIKNIDLNKFISYRARRSPRPMKTTPFFRWLLKFVSSFDLKATSFTFEADERYNNLKEPSIILMNHCSFIDLEIASTIFYPKPINIVATTDAYIGKNWLMKRIGCIPTRKFQVDVKLVGDIVRCIRESKSSVLIYPEAGYSIDGRETIIPESLGKLIKFLKVPVYFVKTEGAFLRQPLYNNLNKHNVKVSAKINTIYTKEEVEKSSIESINSKIKSLFSFNYWQEQKDKNIFIEEENFIEGLNRILYKCPSCKKEKMIIRENYC